MFTSLRRFFLLLFLLNGSVDLLFAQEIIEVNFKKVKQKKIRRLVAQYGLKKSEALDNLQPYCLAATDTAFNVHKKSYIIHGTLNEVWDAYQTISPKNAWSSGIASFGFMYEAANHQFHYENDPVARNAEGQLVFINLKLLKGLFQLAVAHKIVEVNPEEHLIRSCYVKTGKSQGTQYISMKELPDGSTKVTHVTYFLSDSKFRDRYLYPWLHGKIITEFHRNISHLVLLKQQENKNETKVIAAVR